MQPAQAYLEKQQVIESQMSYIKALLNGHTYDIEPNHIDVRELAAIEGQLSEIIIALRGNPCQPSVNKYWVNNGAGFQVMRVPVE